VAYKRLKANGITFVFKYEADHPELLHIFARHSKEPDDAIYFFSTDRRAGMLPKISGKQLWTPRLFGGFG